MTSVFDAWSSCPESSANLALLAPPPGWELLATAPPAPPGAPPPAPPPAPLATALVDRAARHAVVLIRGSKGPEEWKPNFVYAQVPAPVLAAPGAEPPLVHEGSLSQFELVAPAPAPALERLAAERAVDHVTVAGVSLGGAVASLVASALQARVGTAAAGGAPPVVSAALFAPNAGGADFASAYSAQGWPVETKPERVAVCAHDAWPYAPTGGGLRIAAAAMPRDAPAWERTGTVNVFNAGAFFNAAHICSYGCFLAQFSPAPVLDDKCWLSWQPPGAPGSQCFGFPVKGYP